MWQGHFLVAIIHLTCNFHLTSYNVYMYVLQIWFFFHAIPSSWIPLSSNQQNLRKQWLKRKKISYKKISHPKRLQRFRLTLILNNGCFICLVSNKNHLIQYVLIVEKFMTSIFFAKNLWEILAVNIWKNISVPVAKKIPNQVQFDEKLHLSLLFIKDLYI